MQSGVTLAGQEGVLTSMCAYYQQLCDGIVLTVYCLHGVHATVPACNGSLNPCPRTEQAY